MSGPPGRSLAHWYARVVVKLRFLIVAAWLVGAAVALFLPRTGDVASGDALGSLVPKDTPAAQTQIRSARLFRFPVLTNTMVVQRDRDGLPAAVQRRVVARAVRINEGREDANLRSIAFALPITNALGIVPGSREVSTTAITYLYFDPRLGLLARDRLAHRFAERRIREGDDALVGVTGVVPARVEQGRLIQDSLPLIEGATVLLIALVIGLTFRSLGAPLLTLASVAIADVIAVRGLGAIGDRLGIVVPREVEPVILVLLLGIVTDYSIFFLSGFRERLRKGRERREAAREVGTEFGGIITTAGLIVAAGTASLLVAQLEFFRIFGPALAFTVLVGLAVALTFVPAALAISGRALFWPAGARPAAVEDEEARAPFAAAPRIARSRVAAAAFALLSVAALAAAASGLRRAELEVTPIRTLPADAEAARAAASASEGFVPGVLSPTVVLLEQPGLAARRVHLERLERLLEKQPGVAGVVGPADLPTSVPLGAVLSRTGSAARYVVLLEEHPLSSAAIDDLAHLRERMPGLLAEAGLDSVRVGFAGNTALGEQTLETVRDDLRRIGVAVLVVNFVLLFFFLRSLVAPLYLLATSVLALAASLGVTAIVFELLGFGQLSYYVPFMAAVLLVSLGSDYNVFLVGRIWQDARERPLREAIATTVPVARRAINIAGIALALSFALLALIPLVAFRQFAFAMFVGVLVVAFLIPAYLVPALLSLVGDVSRWPGAFRAQRAPAR